MFLTLEMIRSDWMKLLIVQHLHLQHRARRRASDAKWRKRHPDKVKVKQRRDNHSEAGKRKQKKYSKTAKAKARQHRYFQRHTERRRKQWCDWNKRNREQVEAYRRNRYHTDPQWNIMVKCRRRIWDAFDKCRDGRRSQDKAIKLLGCSFTELRDHITKQFTDGMTWQKVLDGEIHLDHKRPIDSFDLTKPEEVAAAFHYSNVQPLWKFDNLRKGAKLEANV